MYGPKPVLVPHREEWGLINNQKLAEYERMKLLEKMEEKMTKKEVKQQLDLQVTFKKGQHDWEKEEDRKYKQYVIRSTQEMKAKEERERYEKFLKRKQIENENRINLQKMSHSFDAREGPGYRFDIGGKSQFEHRQRESQHKKQMIDALDQQIEIKQKEKIIEKHYNQKLDDQNLRYQYNQFDRRKYHPKYKDQNMNVYDKFKSLQIQKKAKEDQLQKILVEEAAAKKNMEEQRKLQMKQQQKYAKVNQMKHTLDVQIQQYKQKAIEGKKVNPQELTYGVIGNIFKPRQIPYNKKQYSQYLRKQAQDHRQQQRMNKYMSEQQYRLNVNHLNNAVNGLSPRQQYLDRSIVAIGQHPKKSPRRNNMSYIETNPLPDADVDVVKMKLDNIRQKNSRHNFY